MLIRYAQWQSGSCVQYGLHPRCQFGTASSSSLPSWSNEKVKNSDFFFRFTPCALRPVYCLLSTVEFVTSTAGPGPKRILSGLSLCPICHIIIDDDRADNNTHRRSFITNKNNHHQTAMISIAFSFIYPRVRYATALGYVSSSN
jgi:hypothetical protein